MLKTVYTYTTPSEAHITKGRLLAEGIPAFVMDEYFIATNWDYSLALGGVRLQVPVSYFEQATQVMSDLALGKYQEVFSDSDIKAEHVHCPRCNSVNTHPVDWIWKLSLVTVILMIFPMLYSKYRYKCYDCKKTWIATEERSHSVGVLIITALLIIVVLFSIFYFLYYWKCNPYDCFPPFE